VRLGRSGVSISILVTAKEQEHPAAAAVGVIRVMSASSSWQRELSISGARAFVKG